MRKLKLIVVALLAVAVLVVMVQNTQTIETKLLFTSVTMSQALLLGVTLLVGFVMGLLAPLTLRARKKS